jgi:hypothetical protein
MEALAQEYETYFDRVAKAWQEIGADNYLAGRLTQLMTFREVWDFIVHKIGGRVKKSLDPFRRQHNIIPLSFREQLVESVYPVETTKQLEEPRNEMLERTADDLGIKSHILQADIKGLAWLWEQIISEVHSPAPSLLLTVLRHLVKAYLRGRDFRMGNYQGIKRHLWKKTAIMRLVTECAAKDKELDSLHKAGVISVGVFREAVIRSTEAPDYNVLEEVKQFLEEEEGGEP